MPKQKETVLITGGAGYIGSHAVKLFLEKGYKVVVLDNLSRGWKESLEILGRLGSLEFVKGDLRKKRDIEKVFEKYKISAVLHFAALCSVNESMEQPELYFENNVLGSFNLLEAMRKARVKKIIFSSTCATYGETKYLPVDERHPQEPANPYGESKLLVEKMLKWYGELHGFQYVILRYFNVCGAASDGSIGDSKKPSLLLLQNAVRGAMGIEPFFLTCPTVKTPDKTPIRDYIDVEDLVAAHFSAFQYLNQDGKSEILNLGNGRGYSVGEIVSEVEKTFQIKMPREHGATRKGEYAAIYADPRRARRVLKWKTKKTLQDSIESLRKWYENRPAGYVK
jgi:UDP-glucose 4-epimerase